MNAYIFDYQKINHIKNNKNVIYKIINTVNNKIYIGKTQGSLIFRIRRHCAEVRAGTNRYLYDAIRHYGWDNFQIEILEYLDDSSLLNDSEIFWIWKLQSNNKLFGYNMTEGGDGCGFSEESLKKSADMRRGKPVSDETKKKISESNKGKKCPKSKETREKLSLALKGKMPSKPINELMKGKPPGFSGHNHTDYSKKLISLAKTGKPIWSDEQKQKMKLAFTGTNNPTFINICPLELTNCIVSGFSLKEISNKFDVSIPTILNRIKILLKFDNLVSARNALLKTNKKINSKLTIEDVKSIKEKFASGLFKQKDLAIEFNVGPNTISHIAKNRTWKEL